MPWRLRSCFEAITTPRHCGGWLGLRVTWAGPPVAGAGGDPSFYYSAPKGGVLWVFSVEGSVSESSKYSQDVIPAMLPEYKP